MHQLMKTKKVSSGCELYMGAREFASDEFVSGVLDYYFVVGVLGLGFLDVGLGTSFWDKKSGTHIYLIWIFYLLDTLDGW